MSIQAQSFDPLSADRPHQIICLPTSFSKHLASANGATDDLIYVVGWIAFANDLALAGIRSDDTDPPN